MHEAAGGQTGVRVEQQDFNFLTTEEELKECLVDCGDCDFGSMDHVLGIILYGY